jgi:hypothetical protein
MAGLILIGLIIVLIIYLLVAKRKKRALVISAVILGAYMLYVRYTCGPDPRDVRVMKPMAEAISDYIIKHGVPKSLQDIPNLPYRLEGCETKMELGSRNETCTLQYKPRKIDIYFTYSKPIIDGKEYEDVFLKMRNSNSETGSTVELHKVNNGFKIVRKIKYYSWKTSGICNPMRQ